MHCSNHFCGANAIHPYHLPVVANRLRPKSQCIVRIIFVGRMRFAPTICPLWQIASALNPNALFESFLWGECDSPLPFARCGKSPPPISQMRYSNHFCGANAIRPYHLPVVANRIRPKSESHPPISQKRCSERVVAVVLMWWLPLFEKVGCRCSEMVGCKCHLQPSQMAFASLADGICDHCRWHLRTTSFEHRSPPLPNIDHQGFRTSATTLSERRRQILRTPTIDVSNAADSPAVSGRQISRTLYVIFGLAADRYLPVYQYFNQSFMLASPLSVLSPSAHGCLHHQTLFITLPKLNFGLQRYVFLSKQTKSFFLKVITD